MIIRPLINTRHFIHLIKRNFTNKSWFDLEIDKIRQELADLTNKEQELHKKNYGCNDPNCEIHKLGKMLVRVSLNAIQSKRISLMERHDKLKNYPQK
jgi:hypothetical protein